METHMIDRAQGMGGRWRRRATFLLGCVATASLAHAAQAPALNDQQFAVLLIVAIIQSRASANSHIISFRHATRAESRVPAPDLAESWTRSRIDVCCSPQASATIDRCTAQPPPARERAGKLEVEPFLDTLPVYRYRLEHRRTPRR